jgi:hypothetical protein
VSARLATTNRGVIVTALAIQMVQENFAMKRLKIALLAGALAFATTGAFAQVNVGGNAGASSGTSVGTGSGTNSNTQLNSGANVNAGGAKAGVDASGSANTKMKKNQTTGSGAAGASGTMKLDKE